MVQIRVRIPRFSPFLSLLALTAVCIAAVTPPSSIVSQTTCNGKLYTYEGLVGYGFVPSNFTDKFGDTISLGSSIAFEKDSWKKKDRKNGYDKETYYAGTLWMLPDRGWNTNGTTNWQPRIHKFGIEYTPVAADDTTPSPTNIKFSYVDTILFKDPSGKPLSGLDPTTVINYPGYPALPAAKYTGDGFGGKGPGGTRVSLDAEGLVLASKGGFWISDEYGPYVYQFDSAGKMKVAVRPPDAYIPKRNGTQSFSAAAPPIYDPELMPDPEDPDSGRSNNQGFEGLTVSPDGKTLYVMLQSATIQDGGLSKTTNRYARLLQYDISQKPKLSKEFVVPLPQFVDPTEKKNPRTAAQSEIHFLGNNQFFALSRDSFGRGEDLTESQYRQIDVFDLTPATNILPKNLFAITTTPKSGTLISGIDTAKYCSFLNFNDNTQLARFGLHNGGADDQNLLNSKWESIAILPLDSKDGKDNEYLVLSVSDNDFITQDGHIATGGFTYKDGSGLNQDNQALLFKVKLPRKADVLVA